MDAAGIFETFDAERSDFGHASVIEEPGAEGGFDSLASLGNIPARFAGDDQGANGGIGQIDLHLRRDFGHSKRISRRAADHGHFVVENHLEPRAGAQAAGGDAEMAHR